MNIPDGWKLVPLDPTEEMINQGVSAFGGVYRAMIDAAPTPPAQDEPVAWVEVKDSHNGPYEFHGQELLLPGKHNLYTRPQSEKLRQAAEEACDMLEGYMHSEWLCSQEKEVVKNLRAALEGK